MNKPPLVIGLHANPPVWLKRLLILLPFVLVIIAYLWASDARLAENPADKILPSLSQMGDAIQRMAFAPDRRTGDYLLWQDTLASLTRIVIGVGSALLVAILLGLNIGLFVGFRSVLLAFITMIAMVPPLAILPILFIAFGVDEFGKIALIFIGTFPVMTRDIYLSVIKVPREQLVKSLTMGASSMALTYRIILPQVLPRAIDSLRLCLGAAWLFLIASEAIAATEGLGYRIFLMRRYLAMDVIIPYVAWITFLGFTLDFLLSLLNRKMFSWYAESKK
ncbi:ABC transporter permease [Zooshikella sp. RANM57]|uniref:ABC transporter permease n=1 Tax=Zooshikella sp. RANM57 TaxID=3425863 RepID=UPI003D6E4695